MAGEVAVQFSRSEVDAQVAASALSADGLHPRLVRDDAMLGVAGALSIGRFAVLVPADEAWRAREVLQEPEREPPEENVILRAAIIAGGLLALLLAAALLAGR